MHAKIFRTQSGTRDAIFILFNICKTREKAKTTNEEYYEKSIDTPSQAMSRKICSTAATVILIEYYYYLFFFGG